MISLSETKFAPHRNPLKAEIKSTKQPVMTQRWGTVKLIQTAMFV